MFYFEMEESMMKTESIQRFEISKKLLRACKRSHEQRVYMRDLTLRNNFISLKRKIIVIQRLRTMISQNNALHNHFTSAQIFTLY